MDKAFVAQRVAQKVWTAEDAVDTAMVQAAELMTAIMAARQELKVSAEVTDKATSELAAAISALGQARTSLIAAHGELAEAKLRVGIRTKLIGMYDKPPRPNGSFETAERASA